MTISMRVGQAERLLVRFAVVIILTAGVLRSPAYAEDACPRAELLEPASATIGDSRPLFRWKPLPGVERYRMRLQSRVPEGEVVLSLDTIVEGTSFRPPRPLTSYRAMVKVLVTSDCPAANDIESGLRLLVDTGMACTMSPIVLDAATRTWTWNAASAALDYEVLRFETPGGRLSHRSVVIAPARLHLDGEIVAVRARCESGYSDLRFAP